ncbi:MAG: DNA polymerase I [Magnetococcales bacterium]|nr:DNA polymerase I [Magnetococcales bacterium]
MNTPRLFLIDGSGYLYRAFHGIRSLSRRDGFPTNAIFGFVKMVRKVIDEHHPEYLAMVFDTKGPTFRHELDPKYKQNRKPMPDDLRAQIPIIKEVVSAYRIPQLEQSGYEADDIIGTLTHYGKEAGLQVVVVSGDKDLMQLVGPTVSMLDSGRDRWFDELGVQEHWGVPAEKITDLMGLSGDTSDDIPGVPGIGVKTAAKLINDYGSLDALLAKLDTITQPKRRQNLIEYAEQAILCRQLASLDLEVPLEIGIDDLKRQTPDVESLRRLFSEMEFRTFVRELDTLVDGGESYSGGELSEVQPETPELDYQAITTTDGFNAFLAKLKQQGRFAFDTETTSLDTLSAELVGLSFSWEEGKAWYLPVGHALDAAPDGQLDRQTVLDALKPIFEDPKVLKTGQNIKYDLSVLASYDITLKGLDRDTMLFSHLIYGSQRRHNLDVIAMEELGRTTLSFKDVAGSGKKQLTFDRVPLEKAIPYACEDADIAWSAAEKMAPLLTELSDVQELYRTIEKPLIPILSDMERIGTLVDRDTLSAMSKDFTARREVLTEEIHALAGEAFNVNSTQQLGMILFDKMGIKGGKRTKTGFSTNVNVLTKLAEKGHEIPAKVLDYRALTKLQSTYTDALLKLIHPTTGRVHTSYNQAVTATGRLSSSDPNLQNIPIRTEEGRAIRTAFIAPEGWTLMAADYSQIELRLLAHMGDVDRLKTAFSEGRDIHSATAAELFGGDSESVTGDQRRMAKTINFGLIYGMSVFGLAKRLGVSNPEARDYMDLYFSRYQGVRQAMDRSVAEARDQGYVTTLGGRRCLIPEINSSNRMRREFAERTAINAPIQGSAADLIKKAMITLHSALKEQGFKARMILQVHDELVLEVPNNEREAVDALVRSSMESAMQLSVPLNVEIGTGPNWALAH